MKQPQDHKPKAGKPAPFTFIGRDGHTYELPPITSLLDDDSHDIVYGDYLDAMNGTELQQADFAFRAVQSVGTPEAQAALRRLPLKRGLQVTNEWFAYGAGGVSLPES